MRRRNRLGLKLEFFLWPTRKLVTQPIQIYETFQCHTNILLLCFFSIKAVYFCSLLSAAFDAAASWVKKSGRNRKLQFFNRLQISNKVLKISIFVSNFFETCFNRRFLDDNFLIKCYSDKLSTFRSWGTIDPSPATIPMIKPIVIVIIGNSYKIEFRVIQGHAFWDHSRSDKLHGLVYYFVSACRSVGLSSNSFRI